ncbi:MAG: hypothetical protein ACXVR1_07000 [Solirubrobacteraceae bacterium]
MLIEAAVRHIVEAWEESADGSDASATPPSVEVRVRVRAAAWTDGLVRASDDRAARRLELAWTLALDEATHGHPRWRLTHSADTRSGTR